MAGVKPVLDARRYRRRRQRDADAARIDTNSLFITEQLNRLGIDVVVKAIVGDDRAELIASSARCCARAELIVCSGGLGPTDDDLTREVVAAVLGRALSEDEAITTRMRARFVARGYAAPMPESNRRQAMVPAGARVHREQHGSAPGLWIEDGERVVLLLPGPPRELKPMLIGAGRRPAARARDRQLRWCAAWCASTGRIESQTDEVLRAALPPVGGGDTADRGDDPGAAGSDRAAPVGAASGTRQAERRRRSTRRWPMSPGSSAPTSSATTAAGSSRSSGDLLLRAAVAHRRGRVVHRRSDQLAPDRRARQLALRRARRRHLLQRGQDRPARCAGGPDRGTRRGERTGGAGHGRRHPRARAGGGRRRRDRHRRAGRVDRRRSRWARWRLPWLPAASCVHACSASTATANR